MELEKAIKLVEELKNEFHRNYWEKFYTDTKLLEKYEALVSLLQYVEYNSTPRSNIEIKLEILKRKKVSLLEKPVRQAQIRILQELLEENK